MAEYIPLEDIREALEGGTTPSGQPCRHPFGAQPATRSSWNGVRRIGESIAVASLVAFFFTLCAIFGGA